MLSQAHLEKYADVLIWALKRARKGRYKRADVIMVRYGLHSVKLAEVIQGRVLELGMHPVMRMGLTSRMERNFYEKANPKQLIFHPPGERQLYQGLNGGIYVFSPESLTHLRDIDPRRIGKTILSYKPYRDILNKREERGLFGWTLCLMPTPELTKGAGISMKQYARQIVRACYLDRKDPAGEWERIYRQAAEIKKWINSLDIKHLRIESKGCDLKLTMGPNRRWIGVSGHNIPSFEIFTCPDYRGTEGTYYADQPSYRSGNLVRDVRLTFKGGAVVKVSARKGEDFIKKQLSMDKGAKRVGEFSLTDKRFSRINRYMANTLYDENYGGKHGNCHLALGSSYSDTFDGDPARLTKARKERLGLNDSALHWDLVNTEEKRVTAYLTSGKKTLLYEKGMFAF
ncbi:MAG: aminopeptidase [Deltaproteobacteria bacterium]|nr:aminopeptidase [Deltaproteobacteria bacterium]MBW2136088.1 aminopeptidase [Deltaproteobacteria bacterium]